MAVFKNLRYLKLDMEEKGWCIDSFEFKYKQQFFIVLIKLYEDAEAKPDYALLKIEFLRQGDFDDSLLVPANSAKLFVDAKTLREYFNIDYSENLGCILQQFNQHFSNFIPTKVIETKSNIQKKAMVCSLNQSEAENPNKLYCYAVKRNPKKTDGTLGQRSPFNDNKTRLLRPELYKRLRNDTNLSFCYSVDPNDNKLDEDILYNWTKNKNR
ncbi:DUF6037 family protein [Bacillus inaquosorum]|uniref:DUF6037 family protein n=1 Tax=Bacillus inaquosorum TaxID=483913 RepID=A0A9Q4ESI5_9BACI|nr:DUF6037 family protein [Bacillus inaquosorum]MCY7787453.1 DUF6037 family protein [Bacillus inaquosorum]MCY7821481.1 DUF6037 family protein [Bacillus inaquosorum]MCY7937749.1 DUF6037 family protein [Bacillus inaquosorum]MCY8084822.1 DUF6037 family protein [Bacillus inaquosorum]MCY8170941.1 DUF6037 family protein [Bacillus inaquosorum]